MISSTEFCREYVGLSNDAKPTQNITNGSRFLEMDTGKTYIFIVTNTQTGVGYWKDTSEWNN